MKIFFSTLFFLFLVFSFAFAQQSQVLNYKIKKNDSLLEICSIFKVSEKELVSYNTEETIKRFWVGDKIKIPLKNMKIIEHTIKKGDTLFDLVNKYKSDIEIIYSINPESLLEKMWIGKIIYLPISTQSVKNALSKQKINESKSQLNSYKVKKGDSFYIIAKKYDLDYEELKELNSNKNLMPDDVISLPKASKKVSAPQNHYKINSEVKIPANYAKITAETQIKSPESGEIIGIRPVKGYGRAIFIRGKKGVSVLATKGFHNILTAFGSEVKKGQPLAVVKKDYYLHYFLIQNNQFVYPGKWSY